MKYVRYYFEVLRRCFREYMIGAIMYRDRSPPWSTTETWSDDISLANKQYWSPFKVYKYFFYCNLRFTFLRLYLIECSINLKLQGLFLFEKVTCRNLLPRYDVSLYI